MNYETIFYWIIILIFSLFYFVRWIIDIRRESKIHQSERIKKTIKKNEISKRNKFPITKFYNWINHWKIHPNEIFAVEYASYSRIMAYKKCPRSFEIKYLCRLKENSSRAAQIGKLTHEIIQLYTEEYRTNINKKIRKQNAIDDLLKFYERAIASDEITYPILSSEIVLYLDHFVKINRADNLKIEKIEYECNSFVGPYMLKCIIDRIDNGKKIIDYKTGNPKNARNRQLNIYAYALSSGGWEPYNLCFQFLRNGKIREWKYTKKLHDATELWLIEEIKKIEKTRRFEENRSRLCDYCHVAQYCRK